MHLMSRDFLLISVSKPTVKIKKYYATHVLSFSSSLLLYIVNAKYSEMLHFKKKCFALVRHIRLPLQELTIGGLVSHHTWIKLLLISAFHHHNILMDNWVERNRNENVKVHLQYPICIICLWHSGIQKLIRCQHFLYKLGIIFCSLIAKNVLDNEHECFTGC